MAATIISISPGAAGTLVSVNKSPLPIPRVQLPFALAPAPAPPLDAPNAVLEYGCALYNGLCAHPRIAEALTHALTTQHPEHHAIVFSVSEVDDERIYWETIRPAPGPFLALDSRWPVGRIAEGSASGNLPPRTVKLPLTFLAVISAYPFASENDAEWQALLDAAQQCQAGELPIRLIVWVGDRRLKERVEQAALDFVTVDLVPTSPVDFESRLLSASPHFVHMFCHGEVRAGSRFLRFATAGDWMMAEINPAVTAGEEVSALRLSIDTLIAVVAKLADRQRILLVTLNCCQGGQPTAELHSMAHDLVVNGKAPAAIGMLEPIDAGNANAFSSRLYSGIFDYLVNLKAELAPNEMQEVEWCHALRAPRDGIIQRTGQLAESSRAWAVPVLYMHESPLFLGFDDEPEHKVDDLTPQQLVVLQTVVQFLRMPDMPESKKRQFLKMLEDEDIPAELRPDINGQFGA